MKKPELYLIELFRKTVHEPEDVKPMSGTLGSNNDDREHSFLAMDYFDVLKTQKIEIEDDMTRFMDIYATPDKTLTKYDISMQSIPVFCFAEDLEKYEKPVSIYSEVGDEIGQELPYSNPFNQDKSYPYLSLVQVYIMPEIMARIAPLKEENIQDTGVRNKVTKLVIDQFYKDIHEIINDYVRDHYSKDRFKCRVYRSMSAGDFTVAVSSKRPETAFILATLLRARGCHYRDCNEKKERYIFYKTYTLLSCNEQWIHCNQENQNDVKVGGQREDNLKINEKNIGGLENGKFVLRATFSSKYWVENANDNVNHNHPRLNGRYDFSVTLSESAFRYVSKILCDYKLGGSNSVKWIEPNAKEKEILKTQLGDDYTECIELARYIANKHIAYINERYIFKYKGMDIFPKMGTSCTQIQLKEETKELPFISVINAQAIDDVERKLDSVYAKIITLDTNRRNLLYYLNLLKWMLNLCRSISGLSDTRIYSSILIHQIRVVLEGLEDAYLMLDQEGNRNLIPIMEHAFAEAVYSLNTFAKMIRDNNLQSLQTPNYNLETSVSVEKVLVGYGELLNSLFRWYEGTRVCKEIYGLRLQYIPFMIPGDQDESLNTKVLFKEIKANVSDEKLMVVWSSSFCDLMNFGGTVGILFHEVAHNLRYKGRIERNNIITRYCIYLICDQITLSIINDLEQNIPELMESVRLTRLICDSLYEAYLQVLYTNRGIQTQVKDYSYVSIIDFIYNEYNKFTDVIGQINEVDKFIRRCISLRPEQRSRERDKALNKIRELRHNLIVQQCESGMSDYYDDDKSDEKRILGLQGETIDLLDEYIQSHTQSDGNYSGDVSAKVIYNMLLANNTHRDEFKEMLPWYGMVDQFFRVFSECLDANITGLEHTESNKRVIAEIWKIKKYLTRSNNDISVEPSVLASYASPHIVKTRMEASNIMDEATVIYSEVASDLFMYNLVEMTPFGYFSFLSEYAPSDARTSHTYSRRFSIVMYAAFGAPTIGMDMSTKKQFWRVFIERLYNDFVVSADKSLEALYKLCGEFDEEEFIVAVKDKDKVLRKEKLSYWCGSTRAHIVSRRNEYFKRMGDNLSAFDKMCKIMTDSNGGNVELRQFNMQMYRELKKEEHVYFIHDRKETEEPTLEPILGRYEEYFVFLCSYINCIYDRICGTLDEGEVKEKRKKLAVLEMLKREMDKWGFMSSFLHRLYQEIYQEIVTVETLEFLAADYRSGYRNTRKLHDEFVGEGERSDAGKCWMWSYFAEVKELLNHPELRYSNEVRGRTNTSMLEMITELYYRAIHNYAADMVLASGEQTHIQTDGIFEI